MIHELPVIDEDGDSSSPDVETGGQENWRSLEDRENSAEYRQMAEGEFMEGASEEPTRTSRRRFMQLMGASIAMAGATACRKPAERILPYTRMPEEVIPGKPNYYATAMPIGDELRGVVVESHEGRPTKIEGNPDHPGSQGSTGVYEQASILNLYDPDRSQTVRHEGDESSWEAFGSFVSEFSARADGRRIGVIAEASSSPTREVLRSQLNEQFGTVDWATWEPGASQNDLLGTQMLFGRPLRPHYDFSQAEVIVSLDDDFLAPDAPNHPQYTRQFADSRRMESPDDELSRLYVVESYFSVTGGKADNRLRLRASEIPSFTAALAAQLGISNVSLAGRAFAEHKWVEVLADDLEDRDGRVVLTAGPSQPPVVHALCARINRQLGAVGTTVRYRDLGMEELETQESQLQNVLEAGAAGNFDMLVMLGTNPVYDTPADLDMQSALENTPVTVHLGLWNDETGQQATWHLPRSHYLESWGDGRAYDGTLSVIQPLISPLYDTRSDLEFLHLLASGEDTSGHDLVQETWRERYISGTFEARWRRILHDGLLEDSGYPTRQPQNTLSLSSALSQISPPADDQIEVVFRRDPHLYDGRFANNAWMQEQPDPITKVTWDNVAIMSPQTAEDIGVTVSLEEGKHYADLVEVSVGDRQVELPVWILPGHADGSITVQLGYGRSISSTRERGPEYTGQETTVYREDPLANGVGSNVYPLRDSNRMQVATDVSVSQSGSGYLLASTQDHHSMEGRHLVRQNDLDGYREQPEFAQEVGPETPWDEYPSLWEGDEPTGEPEYTDETYSDYQWGMTIDLNTCTGCGVCITACQSENNVPVVGKEEVSNGREMHWIRLDRYFTGEDPEEPGMVMQAVLCMHCENAPCESVCPVAATTHSSDGINEMTYNRCIGTRYCSNNCPYKVRRFNWFNWSDQMPEQIGMSKNPDVTIRSRGVMEKCTYCVQRVRAAGQQAQKEGRPIRDGEVQTACQQACPAQAIEFGDTSDPSTKVSQLKANERNYGLLVAHGTEPRTTYLAQVTNPNPQLEEKEVR